jgi:hypothetical protein
VLFLQIIGGEEDSAMRKLALLFMFALLPAQAWALSTNDLLSIIAMPLAVAAVSNVSGVSQTQLADLVTTLNQANVPPTRFVEVIRYVPVALVDQNGQPFVAFVRQETVQGVTGDALVNAIADRLRTNFNVTPVLALNGEPTEIVVSDNFIPPVLTTQFATTDPLSFAMLPLAVAAVSNLTGVSQDSLATLVATLNNANVPPVQEIQIIRFAPVALVVDNGQPFVQFVQQQTAQGVTGTALVPVVVQQLQTFFPPPTKIVVNTAPAPTVQTVVVERDFVPPVVVKRVEEVRMNPHGGPPGQIKKELGLQTGAEVVHGEKRGRQFTPAPAPVAVVPAARPREENGEGRGRGHEKRGEEAPRPMISSAPPAAMPVPVAVPPGKAKGREEGGPPGQEKGKGGEKKHGKD